MNDLPSCVACGLVDAPYYDINGLCPLCSPEFCDGGHISIGNGAIEAVDSPTTTVTGNSSLTLQKRAREAIKAHGGVRAAAAALSAQTGKKVNHGVLSMAAHGIESPAARRALGLPPPVPVEPCPDCGKVHRQYKTCKPGRKSDKRTLAFRLTDDEYQIVRESINRHPGGRVAWLLERLD